MQLPEEKTKGIKKQWPWSKTDVVLGGIGYKIVLLPGARIDIEWLKHPSRQLHRDESAMIHLDLDQKLIDLVRCPVTSASTHHSNSQRTRNGSLSASNKSVTHVASPGPQWMLISYQKILSHFSTQTLLPLHGLYCKYYLTWKNQVLTKIKTIVVEDKTLYVELETVFWRPVISMRH